jgi:hypothetical protein
MAAHSTAEGPDSLVEQQGPAVTRVGLAGAVGWRHRPAWDDCPQKENVF